MNLHGVVRQAIQSVNPDSLATWQQSTGSTTNGDGSPTPTYNVVEGVRVQVQGVTAGDLYKLNYLNLEGVLRKVFLFGNVQGIVRANLMGGDLLTFPQQYGGTPQVWLVKAVLETWPDAVAAGWSSAIVALQTDVVVMPS